MEPVLTIDEIKELEDTLEKSGISKAELMESAGEALARAVSEYEPQRVCVLCGFGNNGGDGWVAADILAHSGIDVDVVSPIEPNEIKSPLARHVARRTEVRDVKVHVGPSRDELEELVEAADVCVDALLGTGFNGELRMPFTIWMDVLEEISPLIISADVPSGMNADTGVVADRCVFANETVTMLAPKLGLYSADGPTYAGKVTVAPLCDERDDALEDVTHAAEKLSEMDSLDFLSPLPSNIDKYSRGSALIVGGSATYPGAIIMAAKAAARAGAGYVAVATPDTCANIVRMAVPSVPVIAMPSDARGAFSSLAAASITQLAQKFDAVLCGPGMTSTTGCIDVVQSLMRTDAAIILDADALNCLTKLAGGNVTLHPDLYRRDAPLIMTPHYRELSRLVGGRRIRHLNAALKAAQEVVWAVGSSDLLVIAKGPQTAVVTPERCVLPVGGPAALATAGSGDVLAGILAGTLASTHDVESWELLASHAVAVHSHCGFAAAKKFGERSVIATDLIDFIGPALQRVEDAAFDELANYGFDEDE